MPFVGEDEVTCYWGMSGEVLEIPSEAIAANVDVDISWVKSVFGLELQRPVKLVNVN